jgi:hypothetical protein
MLTRRIATGVLVVALGVAGCANNNNAESGAAPDPSASDVVDLPSPSSLSSLPPSLPSGGVPGPGKPPAASGASTSITGTVAAGVEPNCLVLQDSSGSYLLIFRDPAMRADAAVGKKVKLTGQADPTMMTTCQQGVPFIVSAVSAG